MRFFSILVLSATFFGLGAAILPDKPLSPVGKAPATARAEPHRSPVDLAVLPDSRRALTANHTADSVSLVDLTAGTVLAEQACGRKPAAVACSRNGRRAAVSNLWSGTVTLLEVQKTALKPVGQAAVGPFPRGLAFAPDGRSLYVAVNDGIARLDWESRKVTRRWPAPREPRQVVLSADGRSLAAASSRSGEVRCWSAATGRLRWVRQIEDGFNLRGLAFTPDGKGVVCAHNVRREFPVSKENIEQGWVIDSRLTWLALDSDEVPSSRQIALDTRGRAVGDPYGLGFSADGRRLAVSGSGTHELLVLDAAAVPWNAGDPGDFLDPRLNSGRGKLGRLPLGGRPLAVAFLPQGGQAAVANYLLDAVQVVDAGDGKLVRTIALGSPAHASQARVGEALFYDAQRSHHQWFSCNTCHVEGHTCGLTFDTLNDDSYGNPKLTPTLRRVARTGPWTWHGWQKSLPGAVQKSMKQTMFGPRPSAEEARALVAFLETLDHPPNPHLAPDGSLTAAARRGRAVFRGKAGCTRCHHGEDYTSPRNYDVKLEPDGSPYRLWNPPSLRGLFDRGPYLHDGRATTLEDVVRKDHSPEKLGGQTLTTQQRHDLIEFLKSL
ncbi:MAG TPA: cytochrome c peroxidase [Gemmataceae bacterium]|jgi:cytochrome c peroxidase|nr:cytochrome c peroxidase [Gemmataceae bacterium]